MYFFVHSCRLLLFLLSTLLLLIVAYVVRCCLFIFDGCSLMIMVRFMDVVQICMARFTDIVVFFGY